jgi:inosose dehydratase
MALDTAHVTVGGGDPVQVLRDNGDRVRYIHLKDVDMALADREGFAGTARYEAFRDLGEGTVDFPAFWREAERQDFAGPVIVELDISPDPAESARVSRRFVKDVLGF